MRQRIPNLLIVGGDGRNSGKTAMICRIIAQLKDERIIPVKISPHFHEPSRGLVEITSEEGYRIFEETSLWSAKDTSRMLQAGAQKVYYIQSSEEALAMAFGKLGELLPADSAVVCESPALIKYIEPGLFILMKGSDRPSKDISEIENYSHYSFTVEQLDKEILLPFVVSGGEWKKE
ncbi:MAG TPA: hypothetical protein VMT63_14795 [Bacteroidales bacterium]|nr:hypothetical protein [Bacteroidales bacterium]